MKSFKEINLENQIDADTCILNRILFAMERWLSWGFYLQS